MIERYGDLWDIRYHFQMKNKEAYTAITTNGFIRKDGSCVMGRGCAQEAARRFPDLPKHLGDLIKGSGNRVYVIPKHKIITFPVKHNWWENADLGLIEASCMELRDVMDVYSMRHVLLPRPGVGNGKLSWETVRPIIDKWLGKDDRVIVVAKNEERDQ